jgi:hypothetical protein
METIMDHLTTRLDLFSLLTPLTLKLKNTQNFKNSTKDASSPNATTESVSSPLPCGIKEDIAKLENSIESDTSSIAASSSGTQDSDSESLSTVSDVTSASGISSPSIIDFHDRSLEARDARLANSILSLDEDIPQDIDDSIKELLKSYTDIAIGPPKKILLDQHYWEYKQQIAAKRAGEKKLPKSKGRSTCQ